MSYIVLARKYRPRTFDEVIGQPHITDAFTRALKSDTVAHAYLFCGPRGTGKTSCARILAKSLNCVKAPTPKPCGECPSCLEIAKGTSFDVLEIDGASNNGVDEIRTLRENVKFTANYGKYKIYIIDEVHMLSAGAFNALLKTLEEPPEHVKFIFATTAPEKVPATIISRCQRFDFKRIALNVLCDALGSICEKEKFKISKEALYAVGKASQGSFRDALSVLDQLGAVTDKNISEDSVNEMLGIVETQLVFRLADAVGAKDCAAALEILEEIMDKGKDIRQLMKNLLEHFRHLMVIKVGGKALGKLVDYPVSIKEMLLNQTERFSLKDILRGIDLLTEAQENARITETLRLPLEVALAKMTYTAGANAPVPAGTKARSPEQAPFVTGGALKNKKGEVDISGGADKRMKEAPAEEAVSEGKEEQQEAPAPAPEPAEEPVDITDIKDVTIDNIVRLWDSLTYAVSREKMSVATFLQEGAPVSFIDGKLTVAFSKECNFHKETLEALHNKTLVENKFSEKLNQKILLEFVIAEGAQEKAVQDPGVKDVLDRFQGKVTNKWHNE